MGCIGAAQRMVAEEEKVQGLDCYIADAPNGNPKGVIVIIPDAFGADDCAKNGFRVYLPEFMQGIAIPLDLLDSMKALQETRLWLSLTKTAVAGPRVYDFIKALKKNKAKDIPVGTAGFCWGVYFVTQLCHNEIKADNGSRLTDCAQRAKGGDPQTPPEAAKQTEEILKAKSAKTKDQGIEHEFIMYEGELYPISAIPRRSTLTHCIGASHGFAVRADEDDKEEAARGEKAEEQAVQWFSR
ncbi:hypothetical protein AC579_3535 [Pseudocercospora musae]|uniref:Dienelactone hydrolase domain-containing protein n=1 Tax=Pseudocercospora musae TaxID=113226 RepID=A0A139IWB4_9PEZI|nr:hypothetical protein AC579_3535 [Pseudocercospora musae]